MVVCPMLGSVLAAAVNETRSSLPNPSGAFLQLDGHCEVQNSVNGSSMDSIEDLQTLGRRRPLSQLLSTYKKGAVGKGVLKSDYDYHNYCTVFHLSLPWVDPTFW